MPAMWGIHNNTALDLVSGGFISVGWDSLGPLSPGLDREELKRRLATVYPSKKPGAIPGDAGVLISFVDVMEVGDYVVSPRSADRTINFGIVTGPFYTAPEEETHRNRRPVRWVRTDVPRDDFPQPALNEIGSARTLFRIRTNVDAFLPMFEAAGAGPLSVDVDVPDGVDAEVNEEAVAVEEPHAERVETYTTDVIVDTLRRMDPIDFERFTASLLTAMGYFATATRGSGDGGVDVIASRDALGLEPPIVKVQCKRKTSTVGGPEVQQLLGTLDQAGGEVGLFITLGSYSQDAKHLERSRQKLRLLNGSDVVDLIVTHYESLDPEWKRLLPLRRVYAVDRAGDG